LSSSPFSVGQSPPQKSRPTHTEPPRTTLSFRRNFPHMHTQTHFPSPLLPSSCGTTVFFKLFAFPVTVCSRSACNCASGSVAACCTVMQCSCTGELDCSTS
jgi:hypothetical protein